MEAHELNDSAVFIRVHQRGSTVERTIVIFNEDAEKVFEEIKSMLGKKRNSDIDSNGGVIMERESQKED